MTVTSLTGAQRPALQERNGQTYWNATASITGMPGPVISYTGMLRPVLPVGKKIACFSSTWNTPWPIKKKQANTLIKRDDEVKNLQDRDQRLFGYGLMFSFLHGVRSRNYISNKLRIGAESFHSSG
jgi:hypothetical protein